MAEEARADRCGQVAEKADLTGQDLREVRAGVVFCSFTTRIANCPAGNADLTALTLANCNLTKANLEGADLSNVDLTKADLSQANLRNANLSVCPLMGC